MLYTFDVLGKLLRTDRLPKYLFQIVCKPEEKDVFESNAEKYLNHVTYIVYTSEEEKQFLSSFTQKQVRKYVNRIIGQIGTDKSQINASGMIAGFALVDLEHAELNPDTDLQVVLSKSMKEITDQQRSKVEYIPTEGEDLPESWRKRIEAFLEEYSKSPIADNVMINA